MVKPCAPCGDVVPWILIALWVAPLDQVRVAV